MDDKKQAPPDRYVIQALQARMWRGNQWMRKRYLKEIVNRTSWSAEGFRYPSWYQIKRCLREMISSGVVEYRKHTRGYFVCHEYRLKEQAS